MTGAAPGALPPREGEILDAILECIHPADELGPGAAELGLGDYVRTQLAGDLARFVPMYLQGLDALDELARRTTGVPFVALPPVGRETLLRAVESAGDEPALAEFFGIVIEHAYEGLFGDPSYGGNAQGAGWDLVGYPGPRPVLTSAEQSLGHVTPPVRRSIYTIPPFSAGRPE